MKGACPPENASRPPSGAAIGGSIGRTERTGPEEVHTEAKLPDGQSVQGEAWFRVDDAAQRISWGSEGENDYHGSLDVDSVGDGSRVVVKIHSPHVDDGQVQQGVDQTLAVIKEKVEAQGVAQS